ncbi:hypothetical protein [Flavobacterium palustre]|nr:hypothetical protein [Flavobacterium palustre]
MGELIPKLRKATGRYLQYSNTTMDIYNISGIRAHKEEQLCQPTR